MRYVLTYLAIEPNRIDEKGFLCISSIEFIYVFGSRTELMKDFFPQISI